MQIQKPIKNRKQVSSGLNKRIADCIQREADNYDVSKSFVIANALAFAFNIPVEETYKNHSDKSFTRIRIVKRA